MENQPMTQAQRDMQLAALNREYRKKSNEIARIKVEAERNKMSGIQLTDLEYRQKRKHLLEVLLDLRFKRSKIDEGTQEYLSFSDNIRRTEHQLSILKDKWCSDRQEIRTSFYFKRTSLDEESRKLTEWFEFEKYKIMYEFEKSNHDDKDSILA